MSCRLFSVGSVGLPLAFLCLLTLGTSARGQVFEIGGDRVLRSGGGETLVTFSYALDLSAVSAPAQLRFEFGFATDEMEGAGEFLDSFTVTLQNSGKDTTAIYFTVDPSGLVLAPPSEGTLALDAARWGLGAGTARPFTSGMVSQSAYELTAALPPEFLTSGSAWVYLDLFDNQNAAASQGWMGPISVIPEPGWSTASAALMGVWLFWRWRRRGSGSGRPVRDEAT